MADRTLELGWLRILTEVGRSGNLTVAARRLGLTQPGVSYQIRRVEEALGVPLLERHHRGVSLTRDGRRLFDLAARQVEEMDRLADDIRGQQARPTVRLFTDYAFSSLWLMPRMQDFRGRHPEINLQIVATQSPLGQSRERGDVTVAFCRRADAGEDALLLISETVTPVCAPAMVEGLAGSRSELSRARLIHLDGPPASWLDWTGYFGRLGQHRPADRQDGDISFNTYQLVIQATLGEQGVALGWTGLVDDLVATGLLATVGDTVETPDRGYFLLEPVAGDGGASRLVTWLIGQAR
jgi:putative choline sulfate-utilization transcription factor